MALTLKILGSGSLSGGVMTTLYPGDMPVAGKTALVTNVIFTNKHASAAATINLVIRQQAVATDIYIAPKDFQLPAGQTFVFDNELTLYMSTGPDRIRGSALNGDVQYVINGLERDV